jgi:hypothetical protein
MRSLLLSVLVGLVLISGCASDQPTAPATPFQGPEGSANSVAGCPSPTQIRAQITALFPRPVKLAAGQAFYLVMQVALAKKDTSAARLVMFTFLKYTLFEYNRGGLIGGTSDATKANLTTLTASLYCVVGLPAPVIPPSALGPDGAIGIVDAGSPNTVIVNGTQVAGVQVTAGAAPVTTLITVTRLPNSPGPLRTPLDQYPAFYEYTASPPVTFTQNVTVGICQVADFLPPDFSRLKVGHNVGASGFELLPRVSATFLNPVNCNSLVASLDRRNGVVNYVLGSFSRAMSAVLLPEVAQASALGTCCLGGSTKTFSPFGAVDTLIKAAPASSTSILGLASSPVSSSALPKVRVSTPAGKSLAGVTVTFSVSGGSPGSISGGTQVTDTSGVATLGGWTLGAFGPDSVVAVVTPLPGTSVSGSPILFLANTVPSTPIPYQSPNYRFRFSEASGFQAPGFDDSDWSLGNAAFGSGIGSPNGCSLDGTVATHWGVGSGDAPSFIQVRKKFLVPTGWTGSATVGVAIDNDVRVFVNGTEITGTPPGQYQMHEGCASLDDFSFTAPNGILVPGGDNVIAVQGKDRGGTSFLDVRVTLVP